MTVDEQNELPEATRREDEFQRQLSSDVQSLREKLEWVMHIDGSSNVRGAGVRIVLSSPRGNTASRAVRCNFKATNNESEYEALIAGLALAHQMGA